MTIARTAAAIAAAALIATFAVGCTAAPAADPKPSASPTETSAPPQVTDITDAPGTGEGLVGALADSTLDSCEPGDAGWTVTGTVTNPTQGEADYRIYVSLLAGEETRALSQVDADDVAAGATADWSADIAAEGENLSCVLRVERYDDAGDEG